MAESGRVLHVNVSTGGVPKLPVEHAWVSRLGLEGDAHHERTLHGGPHRAVCLFGIEAIERLQSEGHPTEPGGVGENLTTAGIEWSLLPVGTRARIGERLLLELASPTQPCATQKPNFRDGRFSRISIALHPSDSRMYARVLEEGEVRPGDPITLLPPAPDSRALEEQVLGRLDRAVARADLITWRAAREQGHEVHIVDDGELVMAAAPGLPGPAFNCAFGLARQPQLIPEAMAFYDDHGVPGWLVTESPPWPDASPQVVLGAFSAPTESVNRHNAPEGLTIRRLGPADLSSWEQVRRNSDGSGSDGGAARSAWRGIRSRLIEANHAFVLLAELNGSPMGSGVLSTTGGVGWLRGGVVDPHERRRGIHQALIAARARLAADEGCDIVGAWAELGTTSARNLERMGFRQVGSRQQHLHQLVTQPVGGAG